MEKFFDPHDLIVETRNKLPHWTQYGKFIFITFRLADSMPRDIVNIAFKDLDEWKNDPNNAHNNKELEKWYMERCRRMEKFLDAGHGSCILCDNVCRDIVTDSIFFHDNNNIIVHSFVIMPNHIHILMELLNDSTIQYVIRSIKMNTTKEINKYMNRTGTLWQREYFDRIIRNQQHYEKTMAYIKNNPTHCPPGTFTYYNRWE